MINIRVPAHHEVPTIPVFYPSEQTVTSFGRLIFIVQCITDGYRGLFWLIIFCFCINVHSTVRIHLTIQTPLTGIPSRSRKNASRHLQMPQGVSFIYLIHQALVKV